MSIIKTHQNSSKSRDAILSDRSKTAEIRKNPGRKTGELDVYVPDGGKEKKAWICLDESAQLEILRTKVMFETRRRMARERRGA